MEHYSYFEYLNYNGEQFFTVIMKPAKEGKFPTVIWRSPYVGDVANMTEEEIVNKYQYDFGGWLKEGYAVIYQHCKGQGKSSGAFVPYVHEREDGLALLEWIRQQDFYNGEIFLLGSSYNASLHYTIAPYAEDIKGAAFDVQDSERYRLWYRNGQMRKGHANWHFGLYKSKCGLNKNFNMDSFSQLPLCGLSERVLGDRAEDFEQMLFAQHPTHDFWNTRFGGNEARYATQNTDIPILFSTGYNDFYVGGMFKMWNELSEKTKANCAMLVSPYNHGDGYNNESGLKFEKGKRVEQFGGYHRAWFDNIRKQQPLPFSKGKVAYYCAFEDKWCEDFYGTKTEDFAITLGEDAVSFTYDPYNPPKFREEGVMQNDFSSRNDVITLYTNPFSEDTLIKGQMKAQLAVSSNCPDTSFYVNIAINKPKGDYALRHDITSLCYQLGDYKENSKVTLDFCFDEYALLVKKGERLRIDISSTDDNTYVSHTNQKGEYALQTEAVTAINAVYLNESKVILPVEKV